MRLPITPDYTPNPCLADCLAACVEGGKASFPLECTTSDGSTTKLHCQSQGCNAAVEVSGALTSDDGDSDSARDVDIPTIVARRAMTACLHSQ